MCLHLSYNSSANEVAQLSYSYSGFDVRGQSVQIRLLTRKWQDFNALVELAIHSVLLIATVSS